jgi:hypothetical protein
VQVKNSEFKDLWRNGITIQRGVQDVQVLGNTFEALGDQAVSAEPSGTGSSPRRIVVEDNHIGHSNANWAIAMGGGRKDEPLSDLVFRNNIIESGSAYFLRISDLHVVENTISGDNWHSSSLRLENVTSGEVTNNSIAGVRLNNTEGTIQVLNEEGALSSNITVTKNTVNVNSNSTGIYVRDARANITISENTLNGVAAKKGILVETLLTTGSKRLNFTISNNSVQNFEQGIAVSTRGDTYSSMYILNNVLNHNQQPLTSTVGILFSVSGGYQSFAQVLLNSFGSGIFKTILNQL